MTKEKQPKMEEKQIKVEKKEGVAWLTFANPPVNIFTGSFMLQMRDALKEINADPEVKVVVITNAGERAFSAGMSVAEHAVEAGDVMGGGIRALSETVKTLDKVCIAAVNGYCLGGAIEFLLDCDMVIASETATFGHAEINVGQPGGDHECPPVFGKFRAMEFLLSGDRITAQQAENWGLVNKVVPKETFRQEVENFAKRFTRHSGIILSIRRKTIAAVARDLAKISEEAEREMQSISPKIRDTEDSKEGIRSFAEKRPPQWKNR